MVEALTFRHCHHLPCWPANCVIATGIAPDLVSGYTYKMSDAGDDLVEREEPGTGDLTSEHGSDRWVEDSPFGDEPVVTTWQEEASLRLGDPIEVALEVWAQHNGGQERRAVTDTVLLMRFYNRAHEGLLLCFAAFCQYMVGEGITPTLASYCEAIGESPAKASRYMMGRVFHPNSKHAIPAHLGIVIEDPAQVYTLERVGRWAGALSLWMRNRGGPSLLVLLDDEGDIDLQFVGAAPWDGTVLYREAKVVGEVVRRAGKDPAPTDEPPWRTRAPVLRRRRYPGPFG